MWEGQHDVPAKREINRLDSAQRARILWDPDSRIVAEQTSLSGDSCEVLGAGRRGRYQR